MIKPIKKVEDINPEIVYKMTRDCMNPEWIKDFYSSEKEESFTMMINEKWVIIIRDVLLNELYYTDIAKKVSEIIRKRQNFCVNSSDIHLKLRSGLIMDYNYCKDAYYDVINNICQKISEIVKRVELEEMEINYGNIGNPEKIIAFDNSNSLNNNYLPGVSTKEYNEILESEIQMSNYFRKYIVSIIDEDGQIINVEREKITKKEDPTDKKVEFLYDGKVIQEKGTSNFLLHEGLRNALIIEFKKAIDGKEMEYKGKLKQGSKSLIEFACNGFISIWPFYPEDQLDYYGPGNHSLSEKTTFINMPLNPSEKQLKKLRELASVLVFNRDVKEIYTSKVNERNVPVDGAYYKGRGGKNPKELLQYLDNELQRSQSSQVNRDVLF